jgi:hypothetical protein
MVESLDELNEKHQTLANKIFTTFTKKEELQETLERIKSNYTILYNKIFIFSSTETEELICTYNIDMVNCTAEHIIPNTVLLHRKKSSRTLFSINAINLLNDGSGKDENGQFEVDWEKYRESILLTRAGVFIQIHIKLYDIIHVEPK